MKMSRAVSNPEIKWDAATLLKTPALWDAVVFNQRVPEVHEHLWHFVADPEIKYLCVEVPAGTGKTQFLSIKSSIYFLCLDPNERICVLQKGVDQAKGVISSIQRQMTGNKTLIDLYGPFKPTREQEGYPWSTDTMRIAGNDNVAEKTNSVQAYGWASTDVMGNRFTKFLGDDFVTTDNSDTPEKKQKIRTKSETEWDPTMVGAKNPKYFYLGTPMFHNDEFESKFDIASDYLGPSDWRLPDEVDKSGWVCIRRSAEVGKKKGTLLWVEQLPQEMLDEKRKRGERNYQRRYLCRVTSSELQTFIPEAVKSGTDPETGITYPGCLDHHREIGQYDKTLKVICGADPSSGKDTGASGQFAHVTVAFDKRQDITYIVDMFTEPIVVDRRLPDEGADDKISQIGTIVHRHHKYDANLTVIETNSQQHAWKDLVDKADQTVKPKPYNTGKKKNDPDVGIPGMAGMFESGLIRIPYKGKETREEADKLIKQLIEYPEGDLTDLIMALWFCVVNRHKRGSVKYHDILNMRAQSKPIERAAG